jgi:MFS family permease
VLATGRSEPVRSSHYVRAILSGQGFRRLLAVRVLSQIADGWFQAALGGSVLFNPEKKASALAIATGVALLLLPYSIIGPYVGVVLDRWSRRSIVFVANAARTALVIPAALMLWWGNEGPIFVVFAFVIIGVNRLVLAGLSAAVPHVVEDDRLVTANALAGTLGTVSFSLTLGSGVVVVKSLLSANFHGYAALAALAPIGYLASALLVRASFGRDDLGPSHEIRRTDAIVAAVVDVGRGMVAGLRHLASKHGAAYAMAAQAVHRALFGVLTLSILLLYSRYFSTGAESSPTVSGIGLILVAGSLGILAGAFLTPPVTRRIGAWRWITVLLGMIAVTLPVLGLPFRRSTLVFAVFLVSVSSQAIKIVVDTSLQHECDDDFRGRVFSVNDTTYNVFFVVGLFVGALTLPDNGRSAAALVVVAIGYALLTAWYAVAGGRWAREEGDDIARPRPSGGTVGRGGRGGRPGAVSRASS